MNIDKLIEQIVKPFLIETDNSSPISIGLIPGSFRPPHKGHFELIKNATSENDYVYIVGSSSNKTDIKRGFKHEQSNLIWNIYVRHLKNVKYIEGSKTPVVTVYEIVNILNNNEHITTRKDKDGKSIQAGEDSKTVAKELQTKALKFIINVYVGDPDDVSRYDQFEKYPERYSSKNVEKVNIKTFGRVENMKAEYLRNALTNGEFDRIPDFLPNALSDEEKKDVIDLMKKGRLNEAIWNRVSKLKFSGNRYPVLDAVFEYNRDAGKYFYKNKHAVIYMVFDNGMAIKLKRKGEYVGGFFELDIIQASSVPMHKPEQVIDSRDEDYNEWLSKFYSKNLWVKPMMSVLIDESKLSELNLLSEGGAGGHMSHPYDVVKTGKELIDIFKRMVENIKKTEPSIKIDGTNASVRYVNGEFVLDRGSSKPLDVSGIRIKDLADRFPSKDGIEQHGMIKIGTMVLQILNSANKDIQTELKQLGMIDNPDLMLNLEYVSGKSNVKDYKKNFLAIHNMLSIQPVPGTRRRESKIVDYDKSAMTSLINKINKKAEQFEFEVVGNIPATLKSEPNLSGILNTSISIANEQPKSLNDYLNNLIIPEYSVKIDLAGRKASPVSDVIFNLILNSLDNKNSNLRKEFSSDNDYKLAIDGFITKYATMILGEEILKNLDSKLGNVNEQEGVVIHGVASVPVKITGRFMIDKNLSPFKRT